MSVPRCALISCSAEKADVTGPVPARDLYTSALFRAVVEDCEARGVPWRVLSSRHGLLRPWDLVAPYDDSMHAKRKAERQAWAAGVAERIGRRDELRPPVLELHAGRAYAGELAPLLVELGYQVEVVAEGLQIGERLRLYADRRRDRRRCS